MILLLSFSFEGLAESTFLKRPKGETFTRNGKQVSFATNGFLEYLPGSYKDQGEPSPLIIYLHGRDENGVGDKKDLEQLLKNGPTMLIEKNQWPKDRPFVVLAPQHFGQRTEKPCGRTFQCKTACADAHEIRKMIDFATANYNVDPKRIYLTGLSCGALGIGDYLDQYYGDKVAAVVPIAGNILPAWETYQCSLASKLAIWSVFGDQDNAKAFQKNNIALENYKKCPEPRKDIKYTVRKGVGHDAWTKAYADDEVYSWLLKQRRDDVKAESPKVKYKAAN